MTENILATVDALTQCSECGGDLSQADFVLYPDGRCSGCVRQPSGVATSAAHRPTWYGQRVVELGPLDASREPDPFALTGVSRVLSNLGSRLAASFRTLSVAMADVLPVILELKAKLEAAERHEKQTRLHQSYRQRQLARRRRGRR